MTPQDAPMHPLQGLWALLSEPWTSGGSYVAPGNRLLLMGLAVTIGAQDILETGTNTGVTTLALAMTGARVVTVDHGDHDPRVEQIAAQRLAGYANVRMVRDDALYYLATRQDALFDLIFLDDCHWPEYTRLELRHAQRLLRPGGVLVFHDTKSCHLWEVIEDLLPATWQRLELPSWQGGPGYHGEPAVAGQDFGLGVVRKPLARPINPMEQYEHLPALTRDEKGAYALKVVYRDDQGQEVEVHNEATRDLVQYYEALFEAVRLGTTTLTPESMATGQEIFVGYGKYCAERASEAMRRKFERLAPSVQPPPDEEAP